MDIIIITGPKHSGKTSAGLALTKLFSGADGFRRAADSAELCFVDLDELIERRTGRSPRALYQENRDIFREAEAEALASLIGKAAVPLSAPGKAAVLVIAAGGGIIDNEQALALIKKTSGAITVYLEVSADTAWNRVDASARRDGGLPPFLETENPRETHRALHERRAAAYRNFARIIIKAEGKSPEEIAKEIQVKSGLPKQEFPALV
ncbi:MAG: shikimate kinase [Treponema sp.]|nr:shikimate kinase [Treponema sp.]